MALFSRKPKTSSAPTAPTSPSQPVAVPVSSPGNAALEPRIFEIGSDFLRRARAHKSGILSAKFYSDALMEWSMKDPNFKVQLFRFVDCFPMLKTPEDVYDHLTDYLSQPGVTVPGMIDAALKAGKLAKGLAAGQIGKQITGMASKFIAGTDAASALPGLKQLWDDGISFSVDLLGEVCVSDEEADLYQRKYLDLVQNLPAAVSAWNANPRLETDHVGPIPRTNVSIKVSALTARFDPIDFDGSINDAMRRIVPILETARDRGVFVNFDMEHYALKDLTLELFMRCVEKVDFPAGLAMQAYLRSGPDDARRLCEWAKRKNKAVTVRLVKGAYWDAETIKAELQGWPVPVWSEKWQTDACFERMLAVYLDSCPKAKGESGVKLALGSHNARSIAAALALAEQRGLPHSAVELQMLHGMGDQLKYAASDMGLRIREYVPVGDMIPGMAYLVRRLLENTSNESWLKAGFLDNADAGALLRAPAPAAGGGGGGGGGGGMGGTGVPPVSFAPESLPERHNLSPAPVGLSNTRPFFTEPARDFADAKQREAFAAAIARATLPKIVSDRTPDHAREMIGRSQAAFKVWGNLDQRVRSEVMLKAAALMRQQRDGLAAVMIKEAGKTWREADADVCEAIDFCDFYARCAVPLFDRQRLGRFIGELDEQFHQPRGVAIVISPWNFPLAICCGMTSASLVTGNTAIVKASEQTLGIASIMVDILHQAITDVLGSTPGLRLPASASQLAKDILQFCAGPGRTTGAALVRDPRIAMIAFTGSREVGLDILSAAAPPSPFDRSKPFVAPTHVKKVVCEMGGKNALIVDTSADFDEAVLAVRYSAFGYQGQKCSACSRCIVVDPQGPDGPAFTAFRRRLCEAMKALVVGDPTRPGTDVGPVIDPGSKEKIEGFIERGKQSGLQYANLPLAPDLSASRFAISPSLSFVSPHIFWPVPPEHEMAVEEIFGPVLALIHARDFDHALEIANASVFKLTGGVFTRKPAHIEQAKREFRVGNLYINRGITGALVGRHPFGGSGMSGVGTKAGGMEYLYHFVEPRNTAENTMRRGFAPEL
ncbi:RHH-type transcriptional regulator, proline utilization regulon repressor / proline dehydrogenase / delta 1-pyrroline-5-carboxylate dehydrogenase [Phycisphaerales bacterium]|nr:RHH-type transcriptional regulator, proline utilization regulon repressor / proline dehydrogenase / delta 1-pyrroline-5-carboxylate dehydrogenase [Phycisphaerales bacterium]